MKIAIPAKERMMNYKNAIQRAAAEYGAAAEVFFIGLTQKESDGDLLSPDDFRPEEYDALILPGGIDMDPCFYHEEVEGSESIDRAFDAFQLGILDRFVKDEKPILGICRGFQMINVYFGGSLIQDIPEKDRHNGTKDGDRVHPVFTEKGSVLEALYGASFLSNSCHHQAVKKLGEGLWVTARSEDGIIEGTEHRTLPILSVQFHPERMCYEKKNPEASDGSPILKAFLKKCMK